MRAPRAARARRRRAVAARPRHAAGRIEGPGPARPAAALCGDAAGRGARARRAHQPACRSRTSRAGRTAPRRSSMSSGCRTRPARRCCATTACGEPTASLQAAARDFGGHPLALGLLASFLKETQNGDVRRRDHIRAFFADPENPRHDHARRVMESYEKEWLAGQPVLHAIMHMVGLFDRPASGDCLQALRQQAGDRRAHRRDRRSRRRRMAARGRAPARGAAAGAAGPRGARRARRPSAGARVVRRAAEGKRTKRHGRPPTAGSTSICATRPRKARRRRSKTSRRSTRPSPTAAAPAATRRRSTRFTRGRICRRARRQD